MRGVDGLLTFNTSVKSEVEVERLLDIVMDLETIRRVAKPILLKHGIAKASVFGSYARGDHNDSSDVDILIEYAPGSKKSLFLRARLMLELKEALQKDVDVVTEKSLSRFFRKDALRHKKVIM